MNGSDEVGGVDVDPSTLDHHAWTQAFQIQGYACPSQVNEVDYLVSYCKCSWGEFGRLLFVLILDLIW